MRIGLIGYGEVGGILARALREQGVAWVGAWDIDAGARRRAAENGVEACGSSAELLAGADVVISAVTASNTLVVAREAAGAIRPGMYFLDLNSASPTTKAGGAKLVDAVGPQAGRKVLRCKRRIRRRAGRRARGRARGEPPGSAPFASLPS